MKTLNNLILVLLISFTIIGCETMEGFGRDLQKVGSGIEEEADKDGSHETAVDED